MRPFDLGMTALIAAIVLMSSWGYSASQVRITNKITADQLKSLIYSRRIQSAEWKNTEFSATLEDGTVVTATLPDQNSPQASGWDQLFQQSGIFVRHKIQ